MRREAEEVRADAIVTTEKDAVRLSGREQAWGPHQPVLALCVDLEVVEGAESLDALLRQGVGEGRG
jgi:tetraacyldisaccharide-1-P 4'-kinase